MRLKAEDLHGHLEQSLAPLYFIAGGDSFLVQDACDSILAAVGKREGREVLRFEVSKEKDWVDPVAAIRGGSLFSQKKYVEIHFPHNPNAKDSKIRAKRIEDSFLDLGDACTVLFRSSSWNRNHVKAAWFKLLERHGVVVLADPLNGRRERVWLERRARRLGLGLTREAFAALSAQTEGNPAAAAQELAKLSVVFGESKSEIGVEDLSAIDSRRTTVFQALDHALEGNSVALRDQWSVLRREGSKGDSIYVLALLVVALRQAHQVRAGVELNLWKQRETLIARVVDRHRSEDIERLLREASHLDSLQKGAMRGDPWEATERLLFDVAGASRSELESTFVWGRIEF